VPSPETSRANLQKAKAAGKPPRPWRSQSESRLIRIFVWQWHLDRGPWCSGRALARWLGVSHTYIQKLTQTLSRNESDFLREVAFSGLPTIEGLRRAREESRQEREYGWLRTQPRWKAVQFKIGNNVVRDFVPTKPNAATRVANNPFPPDAPTPAIPNQAKLEYNAKHMWNLRMNAEPEKAMRPCKLPRRTRRRPGIRF
jgi:hypothetical protein